jgi:RNA polymerase sigma-70 factor (ECF subfamily)
MNAKLSGGALVMPNEITISYVPNVLTFDELYRAEFPGLVAVATALTGHSGASEDLVQETMVKAFLRWSRLRHFGRPGAWCHRVLMNECRGWLRHRRVEERYRQSYRGERDVAPAPSAEFLDFWLAVRRLPTRLRLVVVLFYAADRPIAEVASILSVPEGTVRSDLSRARIALARDLKVMP